MVVVGGAVHFIYVAQRRHLDTLVHAVPQRVDDACQIRKASTAVKRGRGMAAHRKAGIIRG